MTVIDRISRLIVRRSKPKTLTIAWLTTLLLTGIATLQTWSIIEGFLSDFTIGVFMLIGGIVLYIESLTENGFDPQRKGDVISLITGTFGLLYGVGLIFDVKALIPYFGGVQGGILVTIFTMLIIEGVANTD